MHSILEEISHLQGLLLVSCGVPLVLQAACEAALLLLQLLGGGRQPGASFVQLSTQLRLRRGGVLPALCQRMLLLCLLTEGSSQNSSPSRQSALQGPLPTAMLHAPRYLAFSSLLLSNDPAHTLFSGQVLSNIQHMCKT